MLPTGVHLPSRHLHPTKRLKSLNVGSAILAREECEDASNLATQRSRVCELFDQYLRKKRLTRDFDSADRFNAQIAIQLLSAFRNGVPPGLGQRFDYLYVDEVQDNLFIDALLMRLLCRNPIGLFWVGDTTQTISVGSSFRFNDLKSSFLYCVEGESFNDENRPAEPQTFQLTN
ncbi:hypothetical protein PM082_022740 [Marasmius tenuissimus]|nr:hypothetical protein PM082_022740 [Marasmius tenuissimus]